MISHSNTAPINRIKSLDGIRAIAITMVLLSHGAASFPEFIIHNSVFPFFSDGYKGVQIFFVLSGYLITKLLIKEREKTKIISIKDFYIRRAFRILPIFYLYIAVILIIKFTLLPDIFSSYFSIVIASLYIWNYHHAFEKFGWHENENGLWFLGHFWTLAIEEQFYLIWPFLFKKTNISQLKRISVILIFLSPMVRVFLYFFTRFKTVEGFMYDSILVGCLGAIIETNADTLKKITRSSRYNLYALVSFIILFIVNPIFTIHFKGAYSAPIGISVSSFLIMYLIFWTVYKKSRVQTFLNLKIVANLGIISYSLYIWQQLILSPNIKTKISSFPINFIIIFCVAIISYFLFEKPIMNLRYKWMPKNTKEDTAR